MREFEAITEEELEKVKDFHIRKILRLKVHFGLFHPNMKKVLILVGNLLEKIRQAIEKRDVNTALALHQQLLRITVALQKEFNRASIFVTLLLREVNILLSNETKLRQKAIQHFSHGAYHRENAAEIVDDITLQLHFDLDEFKLKLEQMQALFTDERSHLRTLAKTIQYQAQNLNTISKEKKYKYILVNNAYQQMKEIFPRVEEQANVIALITPRLQHDFEHREEFLTSLLKEVDTKAKHQARAS